MQIRLSKKNRDQLKLASEHMGVSMSALFREGLSRLLAGEIELPTKDTSEIVHTTVALSRIEEDELKTFAEESGISMSELGRMIVMDMLKQLSTVIARIEDLTTRKEALMAREEAFMAAKEGKITITKPENHQKKH